jgi:(p)ppGpp synthase/HD superfamily hydrolase
MRLHAQQAERSDGPYTHHILRVSIRVARTQGADADCIVAALLHDAVEDQPDTLSLLMRRKNGERVDRVARFQELFGESAQDIVKLLTKKPRRLGHKKPEYREFILGLVDDERALLVKVSDFLDNALGILEKPPELQKRLAKKWEPVAPLLIAALSFLKHADGILNLETRSQLVSELMVAELKLRQVLGKTTQAATSKPRK